MARKDWVKFGLPTAYSFYDSKVLKRAQDLQLYQFSPNWVFTLQHYHNHHPQILYQLVKFTINWVPSYTFYPRPNH